MIVTANSWNGMSWSEYRPKVEAVMIRHGIKLGNILDNKSIVAIVRQGKWVILCPGPDCQGAERAWNEGYFMCMSCLNAHVHHQIMRTAFPKKRHEIEQILEPRPLLNRNWELGETMAQLRRENLEHGLSGR